MTHQSFFFNFIKSTKKIIPNILHRNSIFSLGQQKNNFQINKKLNKTQGWIKDCYPLGLTAVPSLAHNYYIIKYYIQSVIKHCYNYMLKFGNIYIHTYIHTYIL